MQRAVAGVIYNVGGGEEATVLEVIEMLEAIAGRPLAPRRDAAATGDVRRTSADTARIRSDLGWQPQTPLELGLRAQWAWTERNLA